MLKNCQTSRKPLEKCVSKVSLGDPAEVQRNQKASGKDCSTHRLHKYMSNNYNPQVLSIFACWNASQNQLRPTPAAEQSFSLSWSLSLKHTLQVTQQQLPCRSTKNIPASFCCWHPRSVVSHLEALRWRDKPLHKYATQQWTEQQRWSLR